MSVNAIGIALVVTLGCVIGTFIDYPMAYSPAVPVFGVVNGFFAGLAWAVTGSALDFFGVRLGRR